MSHKPVDLFFPQKHQIYINSCTTYQTKFASQEPIIKELSKTARSVWHKMKELILISDHSTALLTDENPDKDQCQTLSVP